MKKEIQYGKQDSFHYLRAFVPFIISLIFIIIFFNSCKKEENKSRLSSKSVYRNDSQNDNQILKGSFYFLNGEPGFFIDHSKHMPLGNWGITFTQDRLKRVGLNTTNGKFIEYGPYYNPEEPLPIEQSHRIYQLKDDSETFLLVKTFYLMDTISPGGGILSTKQKVFLTDKNLNSPRLISSFDSSTSNYGGALPLPDGKLLILSNSNGVKKITCYNASLAPEWPENIGYIGNNDDYENLGFRLFGNYIYVLQGLGENYTEKNYRVYKYDLTGKRISTYKRTGKYSAVELIEGENYSYYIFGTKYISEKSAFDACISHVNSAGSLIEEHSLNLSHYLPDWDISMSSVYKTLSGGEVSHFTKAANGYYIAVIYPDKKNTTGLALIKLDNSFKITSVKIIARKTFSYADGQSVNLYYSGERMHMVWSSSSNVYFYVLDGEGNLVE